MRRGNKLRGQDSGHCRSAVGGSSSLRRQPEQALALVRAHRDTVSLANVGSGFWGWLEPEKTLPLVNELLPGKARESIIRDAVSYYAELPDEIPQSKAWFEQLSPELRTLARKSTEGRMFIASSSEVLNSLRSAWDEVEREGR